MAPRRRSAGRERWIASTTKASYAVALTAPATLAFAGSYVRLTNASIRIAEGHAEIADFSLDDGRISSRGTFDCDSAHRRWCVWLDNKCRCDRR